MKNPFENRKLSAAALAAVVGLGASGAEAQKTPKLVDLQKEVSSAQSVVGATKLVFDPSKPVELKNPIVKHVDLPTPVDGSYHTNSKVKHPDLLNTTATCTVHSVIEGGK
jgi:hypothetical protein